MKNNNLGLKSIELAVGFQNNKQILNINNRSIRIAVINFVYKIANIIVKNNNFILKIFLSKGSVGVNVNNIIIN